MGRADLNEFAAGDAISAADENANFDTLGKVFGGDGSDGALSVPSGTTNIDASSANLVVKDYTSISISVGATLALTNKASDGTVLYLRCQGNVTISGTIDLDGDGGAGGASEGATGTNGFLSDYLGNDGKGTGGEVSAVGRGGGGGGASLLNDGQNGSGIGTPGTGGTKSRYIFSSDVIKIMREIGVACGSGGGGGGRDTNDGDSQTGGAGGAGGGVLIIECAGSLVFDGTIDANGSDGGSGNYNSPNDFSGGGGGGGGVVLILANTITTNTGTVNVDGGAGGTNTGTGGSYAGGDGGDGTSVIMTNINI